MSLAVGAGKKVLISGGSIAGPATAFWLNKYGFKTTIVERWPELRPGGQSLDLHAYGIEAIRHMGLEDELHARFTGEKGTTITDKNNRVYAQFPVGLGPTNENEILRGDFAEMLYNHTKEGTNWVFGDYITSIEEQVAAGKVKAGFNSGKEEIYDYVIIADGARSRTRKLVFGEDAFKYKPIGNYIAYFSIPLEDDTPFADQWHVIPLPRQRMFYFRPDFKAKLSRAGVGFMAPTSLGYEKLPQEKQKALLADLFKDGGPNAVRMIKHLDASDDLYFEYLGQVHASSWGTQTGRVVMVGDAAWCATPMSGIGSTLSLGGAYVLAGSMAEHIDNPKAALAAFDAIMRPKVNEAQNLPPGVPRIVYQETEWGVKVFCRILAVVSALVQNSVMQALGRAVGKVIGWFSGPSEEAKTLPDYSHLLVAVNGYSNGQTNGNGHAK